MKNFIKNHYFSTVFLIVLLVLSVFIPNISVTLYGSLAWFIVLFTLVYGLNWLHVLLFGGSMSFESKGIIPQFKQLFKKNK